jgi:hypothetical protein
VKAHGRRLKDTTGQMTTMRQQFDCALQLAQLFKRLDIVVIVALLQDQSIGLVILEQPFDAIDDFIDPLDERQLFGDDDLPVAEKVFLLVHQGPPRRDARLIQSQYLHPSRPPPMSGRSRDLQ